MRTVVFVFVAMVTLPNVYTQQPPCNSDLFGCPTHECREDWETCGFGVVDRRHGLPRTTLCCHSIGWHRSRECRYRSTYHNEYPTNGNWWDQYCLPIYPKYSAWD